MKSLGKTIEELIKVEPALESTLSSIKNKWERYPQRKNHYWKELLKVLNSDTIQNHPKRSVMKDILSIKKKTSKKTYTFEEALPDDFIIGVIPENISDLIRKYDRRTIEIAKLNAEASITRNIDLIAKTLRKEHILSIDSKKLWLSIRDHFDLWKSLNNFSIKIKNNLLVLIKTPQAQPPQFIGPGIVKMDQDTLKRFLEFLNLGEQQ